MKIKPSDKDMIPDDEQRIMADEDMIAADQQTIAPDEETRRFDLRTISREKQSLEDDMHLLPRVGLTTTPDVHLEPRVVPILGLDRSTIGLDILVFTAVEPLLAAEVPRCRRGLDLLLLYNPPVAPDVSRIAPDIELALGRVQPLEELRHHVHPSEASKTTDGPRISISLRQPPASLCAVDTDV